MIMNKFKIAFIVFIGFISVLLACNPDKQSGDQDTTPSDLMVAFPMDWEKFSTGKIDMSFLINKPAGKEGFLNIRDGHFYTPEGKQFRIWGVNLTASACFPEKTEAAKLAGYLASLGINAIRFHMLDSKNGANSSLFRSDTNTTRVLDPQQLDKLDFFVSELKKQGIYSNFNLNAARTYREGDDVPFYNYLGYAKGVTLFDDHLFELQKEFARQLLTHKNPYTENEYRNEPALAFLEIVNENSLVEAWTRGRLLGNFNSTKTTTWIDIPAYYADELTDKYNVWIKKNLSKEEISALYREAGIKEGKLIPRLKNTELNEASSLRFFREATFIVETERNFYSGMYSFLKDSLYVNQLVAANSDHSHHKSSYALLSNTSKLDFVDGHVYWQHPNYQYDSLGNRNSFHVDNSAMVNEPVWSTVVQLARSAVNDKPYTISETNHPYPNDFSSEGIPILAAYSMLQDWDGIYFYTFEHADPLDWKTRVPGHFDISHDPVKVCNLAICGMMFHREDIQPAKNTVYRGYSEEEIIEGIRSDPGVRPFFTPGFPQSVPLVCKTRIRSFKESENIFPDLKDESPILSETGELCWQYDEKQTGLVKIETARTQALIGFTQTMKNSNAGNLSANLKSDFATVVLSSLDGFDIDQSKRLLLVISSKSILSNAAWNADRTSLVEWGEQPFLIEAIPGEIKISRVKLKGRVKVWALDGNGQVVGDSFFTKIKRKEYSFKVGKIKSLWYLIEIE